jgi:hypothetical protein
LSQETMVSKSMAILSREGVTRRGVWIFEIFLHGIAKSRSNANSIQRLQLSHPSERATPTAAHGPPCETWRKKEAICTCVGLIGGISSGTHNFVFDLPSLTSVKT